MRARGGGRRARRRVLKTYKGKAAHYQRHTTNGTHSNNNSTTAARHTRNRTHGETLTSISSDAGSYNFVFASWIMRMASFISRDGARWFCAAMAPAVSGLTNRSSYGSPLPSTSLGGDRES